MKNWSWILKMAGQDALKNRNRLLVYATSIIIGIATLVAIQSFRESLSDKIEEEAKTLLGADLLIRSNSALTSEQLKVLEVIDGEQAFESSFASMIVFPKHNTTRLVFARGVKGNYPFYGQIETRPQLPVSALKEKQVFVDQTVMLQLGIEVNDTIKLGNTYFKVIAAVLKTPGGTGISATVAPPVYLPLDDLVETGLQTQGSRIRHKLYYKTETVPDQSTIKSLEEKLYEGNVKVETVESRKENLKSIFGYLNNFLNLVGFVSLLLGCIGIASSVSIYLKEKRSAIATLRCIGATGTTVFYIYFIEVVLVGVVGSVIGVLLGSLLQLALPLVLEGIIVVDVNFKLSIAAMVNGLLVGIFASVLFALEPLLASRKIPPLAAINTLESQQTKDVKTKWLTRGLMSVFVLLFSYLQLESWYSALGFTIALFVVLMLLAALSGGFSWLLKNKKVLQLPFIFKHGLANIYRPNNQSMELTVTIGLGTLMISLLFFLQGNLLEQLSFADANEQPNMILFDIQKEQLESVKATVSAHKMPIIQETPVIAMRIAAIKGVSRLEIKRDSTSEIPDHIIEREYRVSYRDFLEAEEEIIEGEFIGSAEGLNYVPIALERRTAEFMGVTIGDELKFNVQGVPLTVQVGSIMKVKRNKIQTSFNILFPKGVLEDAPQFYAIVTRASSQEQSADFQRKSVAQFPNVSIVDLNSILDTVTEVVGKIRVVIQFMALFSIITGIFVLIGSIANSRFQRIKEAVLLKTLGASKKQIVQVAMIEYLALGSIAAVSGVLLGAIGALLISANVFDLGYQLDFSVAVPMLLAIIGLVSLIGYLNNRSIVKNAPLMELLKSD